MPSSSASRRRQIAECAALNRLGTPTVARHWLYLKLDDLDGLCPWMVAGECEEGLQRVLKLLAPRNPDGFYVPTAQECQAFEANADQIPLVAADRAPTDFNPSQIVLAAPMLEWWWIKDFPDFRCQALKGLVLGHPHLGHTAVFRSSALIWYDQVLGYARAQTRFYRLGARAERPDQIVL